MISMRPGLQATNSLNQKSEKASKTVALRSQRTIFPYIFCSKMFQTPRWQKDDVRTCTSSESQIVSIAMNDLHNGYLMVLNTPVGVFKGMSEFLTPVMDIWWFWCSEISYWQRLTSSMGTRNSRLLQSPWATGGWCFRVPLFSTPAIFFQPPPFFSTPRLFLNPWPCFFNPPPFLSNPLPFFLTPSQPYAPGVLFFLCVAPRFTTPVPIKWKKRNLKK